MKSGIFVAFATALFFAQNNSCFAVPLDCKEHGTQKGCVKKIAVPAHAVLPSDPAFPIQPDIAELVANSPFFRLPSGDGAPFETHTHSVKTETLSTDVVVTYTTDITTSTSRVAGSPLCRKSTELKVTSSYAQDPRAEPTKMEYLNWAGLIFLSGHTSGFHDDLTTTSTIQVTKIDKLSGQPFPLKAKNTFSLEIATETEQLQILKQPDTPTRTETKKIASVKQITCLVGETVSASAIQADLKGTATTLTCTYTYTTEGAPSGIPLSIQWLDSVGCFVPTPKP